MRSNLIVLFFFFFLIFGPKVGAFGDTVSIFALFLVARSIFLRRDLPVPGIEFGLIAFYALHSNAVILFSASNDTWHLFQPWRLMLNYMGLLVFVNELTRIGYGWGDILEGVNKAVYIHSFIVILFYFNPGVSSVFYAVTGFVEKSTLRTAGLTHSYGTTSLVHLAPLYSVFFLRTRYSKWLLGILYIATVVSIVLMARVGLYAFPFLVSMAFVYLAFTKRFKVRYAVVAVLLSVSLFVLLDRAGSKKVDIEFISPFVDSDTYQIVENFFNVGLRWSFEAYYSYEDGGGVGSFETIGRFLYFNETFGQYIYGTGHYGREKPHWYLPTDISYAHFFSMVGFLGVVTLLLIYIVPLFVYKKAHRDLRFIYFLFLVLVVVTNYKEATFFTRTMSSVWLIYLFALRYDHAQNHKAMSYTSF